MDVVGTLTDITNKIPGLSQQQREIAYRALKLIAESPKKHVPDVAPGEVEEAAQAQAALEDLPLFARIVWPIIEPGVPLKWNWHLDELCDALARAVRGEPGYDRQIYNVPPATTKSTLVSVIFHAWVFARDASKRTFKASYGDHLSMRDNLRVRDIVACEWFQKHYPLRLAADQNAKSLFKTTAFGWSFATSVGGAGTGEHPDILTVDDPTTAQQAKSKAERERANDWFDSTISTRGLTRKVIIIVIMQRLHEMDLTGHLLAKGGYKHLCFPMRFDSKNADPRDHRTVDGELLWPEVFDEELVQKTEIALGPYNTAGQFQQRPSPQGGGLFKREWFDIVEELPRESPLKAVRFWDTASTEGGGDWTVGLLMLKYAAFWIIADVVRGQWSPAGVELNMKQTAVRDGRTVKIREEQESGASGKAVISRRAQTLVGYDYSGITPGVDKETRAGPVRAQCEFRNVRLLRGPWNAAYLEELCVFPNGAHDDQVDTTSGAFNELTGGPVRLTTARASWG